MNNNDEEEIVPLESLSLSDLSDKCTELWFNYGASSGKDKSKVRNEYNTVAEHYNKRVGWKCMSLINSTTIVETKEAFEARTEGTAKIEKKKEQSAAAEPVKRSGTIIQQILALHKEGKTNKEIIDAGFNKSTVSRQVSEYKKSLLK